MRVAFTVFGGDGWTGGINYLRNLLSALAGLRPGLIEPLLFHEPQADPKTVEFLAPLVSGKPIAVEGWSRAPWRRASRLMGSSICQRDWLSERVFREAGVDLVFQHMAWYGLRFSIPTLAWIADFQHRRLPHMFSPATCLKRNIGYAALSRCATRIMVSSQDARADCERDFPRSRGRISVLPFRVELPENLFDLKPASVQHQYGLPHRFFYLPNQLWRHKNHLGLIEALRILVARGRDVVVAVSGNPKDGRNPDHAAKVFDRVSRYCLEEHFRFLGMVPREHILPLMRASLAVINPSLFEGWSTTVEEATAVGVPLLLSDISVHREQAGDRAWFFDPNDPQSIALCLETAWAKLDRADREDRESEAVALYSRARKEFAANFLSIVDSTAKHS